MKYYRLTAEGIFDIFNLDKKYIVFLKETDSIMDLRYDKEKLEKIKKHVLFKEGDKLTLNQLSKNIDIFINKENSAYKFNKLIKIEFYIFNKEERYGNKITIPSVFYGTIRDNIERNILNKIIDMDTITHKEEISEKEYKNYKIKNTFK